MSKYSLWIRAVQNFIENNELPHFFSLTHDDDTAELNFHFVYPAGQIYQKNENNKVHIISSLKSILRKKFNFSGIFDEKKHITFIEQNFLLTFPRTNTEKNELENILFSTHIKYEPNKYQDQNENLQNINLCETDKRQILEIHDSLKKLENIFSYSYYLAIEDDENYHLFIENLMKKHKLSKECFVEGLSNPLGEAKLVKESMSFDDPAIYCQLALLPYNYKILIYELEIKYGKVKLLGLTKLSEKLYEQLANIVNDSLARKPKTLIKEVKKLYPYIKLKENFQ